MTARLTSDIDRSALKTATRAAVVGAGGLEAAASVCRLSKTSLAAAYDPNAPERFAPIDVAADLDACGPSPPPITATLARLAGYRLVRVGAAEGRLGRSVAQVLSGAAEVGAAYARATEDGRVTAAERSRIAAEIAELVAAGEFALAVLATAGEGD